MEIICSFINFIRMVKPGDMNSARNQLIEKYWNKRSISSLCSSTKQESHINSPRTQQQPSSRPGIVLCFADLASGTLGILNTYRSSRAVKIEKSSILNKAHRDIPQNQEHSLPRPPHRSPPNIAFNIIRPVLQCQQLLSFVLVEAVEIEKVSNALHSATPNAKLLLQQPRHTIWIGGFTLDCNALEF